MADLASYLRTAHPPRDLRVAPSELRRPIRRFVHSALVLDVIVAVLALLATVAGWLGSDDLDTALAMTAFAWMFAAPFFGVAWFLRRRNRAVLARSELVDATIDMVQVNGARLELQFDDADGQRWWLTLELPNTQRGPQHASGSTLPLLVHPSRPGRVWLVAGEALVWTPGARRVS